MKEISPTPFPFSANLLISWVKIGVDAGFTKTSKAVMMKRNENRNPRTTRKPEPSGTTPRCLSLCTEKYGLKA